MRAVRRECVKRRNPSLRSSRPGFLGPALTRCGFGVEATGWKTAGDITADDVNACASKMREERRSAQPVRNHLSAIKAFTRWLARHGKLPRDPLESVTKPNGKTDRRRERRMLLPEEWDWLRSTSAAGPERRGMTGSERALLYATAIQTGLRASELASLTQGQLFLDTERPYITCKAAATKNKQAARQYVRSDLAAQLTEHIAAKTPGHRCSGCGVGTAYRR